MRRKTRRNVRLARALGGICATVCRLARPSVSDRFVTTIVAATQPIAFAALRQSLFCQRRSSFDVCVLALPAWRRLVWCHRRASGEAPQSECLFASFETRSL